MSKKFRIALAMECEWSLEGVLLQVKAVDADAGKNAQISYKLQPSGTGRKDVFPFDIDARTGAVLLVERLSSADINTTHQLTVIATDAGTPPLSSATQITLKVNTHTHTIRVKVDVTWPSSPMKQSLLYIFVHWSTLP